MKTTILASNLLTLSAAILLISAPPLAAQTPGSIASVTLALKRSYSVPGTAERDENGKTVKNGQKLFSNDYSIYDPKSRLQQDVAEQWVTSVKTGKYSNREFLLDLIQLGVLPEKGKAPFISGWSIVQVKATISENSFTGGVQCYVRHKDGDIIDLGGIFQLVNETGDSYGANKEKWIVTDVFRVTPDMQLDYLKTSQVWTLSGKSPAQVYLDFQSITGNEGSVDYAELQGTHTGGWNLSSVGPDKKPVLVLSAGKYTGISGGGFSVIYSDGEAGEEPYEVSSVFEGSVSTGRGSKTADVSNFPGLVP